MQVVKTIRDVLPSQVKEESFARSKWCVDVANETDPSDLLDWKAWVNVSGMLKARDHIEVMPEDGSWLSELIVRHVEKGQVSVARISLVKFDDAAIPTTKTGDYEIKWRGPNGKFGVLRKHDGECLQSGFETRALAHEYIAELSGRIAAAA